MRLVRRSLFHVIEMDGWGSTWPIFLFFSVNGFGFCVMFSEYPKAFLSLGFRVSDMYMHSVVPSVLD